MKSKYILCLYEQYCNSIGKEYIELNIFTDINFINWIESLVNKTKLYSKYLDYLNIPIYKDNAIELGKGKFDTLGEELVTIVSPFAETLGLQNSNFSITEEGLLIFTDSSLYSINDCDLFLTQNPYNISSLNSTELIHNTGLNICIGMYGNINDKDKISKLNTLKKLYQNLADDTKIYYETINDTYLCCLKSDRYIKRKKLIK